MREVTLNGTDGALEVVSRKQAGLERGAQGLGVLLHTSASARAITSTSTSTSSSTSTRPSTRTAATTTTTTTTTTSTTTTATATNTTLPRREGRVEWKFGFEGSRVSLRLQGFGVWDLGPKV